MDAPEEKQVPAPRSCPECGAAVASGQRRCTNCGAGVEARRRLPRRTPLVAALSVLAISGAAVVVAQAAVTEDATSDASAPADVASAPVQVAGAELPAAKRPTSRPPVVDDADIPPVESTPGLDIPSLDDPDLVDDAADARDEANSTDTDEGSDSPDGTPTDEDQGADPDDLQDEQRVKIVKAINYNPSQARQGVEFGTPKAAIDKRSRTVWDVNVPADGAPFNVGIVISLGKEAHKARTLKIGTPTPKFGATIFRSDADSVPDTLEQPDGWTKVSDVPSVSDDLEVPLSDDGDAKWTRYILVFITTPRATGDTRAAISNLEVLP